MVKCESFVKKENCKNTLNIRVDFIMINFITDEIIRLKLLRMLDIKHFPYF